MDSAADRENGCVDPDAPLVDVTQLSFGELLERVANSVDKDSALIRAVRRVDRETHSDDVILAGFGNFAPDDPRPGEVRAAATS